MYFFVFLFMKKYPAVIEVMNRRHIMYNAQLEYLAQENRAGRITLIAPDDTLPIGRTQQSGKRMQLVHRMGREAAERIF